MRVLLVEPHSRSAAAIGADLKPKTSGRNCRNRRRRPVSHARFEFDLMLLNLALPDMDGSALIGRIRTAKHATPIIALSANPQVRLKALSADADDVVERTVDPAELMARIRAIVRRNRGFCQSQLHVGGLTLDVDQHEVTTNGVSVHLTGCPSPD